MHSIIVTRYVIVTVADGSIVPMLIHSGTVFSCAVPFTVTVPRLKQNARGNKTCNEAQLIVHVAVLVIVTVNVTFEHTRAQQSLQVTTTVGPQVDVQVGKQLVFKLKKRLQQNIITFTYIFELNLVHLFI